MMPPHNNLDIQAVIFDLGRVIVDFDHHVVCKKLAKHIPHSPQHIYKKIFTSGLERQFDLGRISPEDFCATVQSELETAIPCDKLRHIWNSIFSLNTGSEAIVRALHGRYTLLCLSNTNPWHFQFCREQFSVLRCFESFILSFEVGAMKPSPDIFKAALNKAKVPPRQCIYIDDIKEFVDAAAGIGMQGLHFNAAPVLAQQLRDLGIRQHFLRP